MIELKEGDVIEGQIEFSTNGNASLKEKEKREIFIYKKNTINSLHLDTVKIEIFKSDKKLEGKVIEVVSRFKKEFVGTVQISKKSIFVIPDSNKIPIDFYIKGGLKAENNQKVIVELTKWENTKSPQGKIIKILGNAGENNTEMNSIMFEYGLPVDFPEEVISESELISEVITQEEINKRKDLRGIESFTIDGLTAKDFDDALSYRKLDNGNVEISVHIADVSFYVKEGTKLYKEALNRGTSIYLVDRVISMIPGKLSNGVCSLKPNEDKLTCSAIFEININGEVINEWFGRTVINSCRRFTYDEVQEIIQGGEDGLKNSIINLDKYAKIIRKNRIGDSLDISGIETTFRLDENSKPLEIINKKNLESNKLIEEFMLLANRRTSELVYNKINKTKKESIYRVHDSPNLDKLESLSILIQSFGYVGLNIDADDIKSQLNRVLTDIEGSIEENMISTLITRCMSKARYSIHGEHWGLGFKFYSHWTSPIRRASDLIFHKILLDVLGNDGYQLV